MDNVINAKLETLDLSGLNKILLVKIPERKPPYSGEELQSLMETINAAVAKVGRKDITVLMLPEVLKPELISNAAAKKIIKELRRT